MIPYSAEELEPEAVVNLAVEVVELKNSGVETKVGVVVEPEAAALAALADDCTD